MADRTTLVSPSAITVVLHIFKTVPYNIVPANKYRWQELVAQMTTDHVSTSPKEVATVATSWCGQ
jgi:hypothetical protein